MATSAQPKEKPRIRTILDPKGSGDCIISKETKKQIILHLKLAKENRKRFLGSITKSTRTFNVRRVKVDHLHWKSNSYGFNEYIIKNSLRFETVCLTDDSKRYKIPKSFILEYGKHMFFKEQGFELQLFVTLEDLEQFEELPIV